MDHPTIQKLRAALEALGADEDTRASLDALDAELAAARDEKAKFVSVIAHELRLPMTSIQGYTDLLRQGAMGEINDNQREFLKVIRSNVHRMNALVTSLSDMTKAEVGRLMLEPGAVALRPLVEKAAAGRKEALTEFEQTLDNQVPDGLPDALADPQRVQQVLEHLIDNAARYADPGGTITVDAEEKDGAIRLTVHDRGYGVAEEDQPNVFEPFYRSDDQRVRDRYGWGLGLSVCRQLVALMSGDVGLESTPGEGTTVWVDLPKA